VPTATFDAVISLTTGTGSILSKAQHRRSLPAWGLVPLAAAFLMLVGACGLFEDPGFIVHSLGEVGSRDLVVMRGDGTDRRIVNSNPSDDFSPVWSPKRDRFAFLSNRDGNIEIYVSSADGSGLMRVTNTGVDEGQVAWSPDGQRIAYTSPDADGNPRVFWLRLSDLLPNRLLFGSDSEADSAWSPEGKWVAFALFSTEGDSLGLILRNPDGVNRLQISQSPDRYPSWSPDGKKLAFVSIRDGDEEIYAIRVGDDGPEGQAVRITDNPSRDFNPAWSTDGKRIAFLSDRNGGQDIFSVNDKGEDLRALTRNNVEEVAFAWGPDGRIVFESRPSGKSDLFVTDSTGAQFQRSSGALPSTEPDW
jgi:TolB protein